VVKIEVVSKDVGARENGAKARVTQKYSLARPNITLQKKCL
jgi:hypothetical protein